MHPLGVVPKAKVDCWQSALGFIISVFPSFDYGDWISQTGRLVDSVSKAKVDCWQSVLGFISSVFPSFDYVEWISQTGGGTLSAPTGCSPRDCGRLLAVDYSLKEYISFLRSTGRLYLQ